VLDDHATQCHIHRKPWRLAFPAEAKEVAALRRTMHSHLHLWGLPHLIPPAQLCVSELVANVVHHVGEGTATELRVSMRDTHLRIEVHDGGHAALPTRRTPGADSETGRGLLLLEAFTDRWGVDVTGLGKRTWCELATGLDTPHGHAGGPRITRTESLLHLYGGDATPLRRAAADLITDLIHWLRAHGHDPDTALDQAQDRAETEALA
jgi:anti-sigma regulatory factor (Ser/Thr protein kinase)